MAIKRNLLTQEQFDRLPIGPNWKIDEVPPEHWDKIPGIQRLGDTIAIMASGSVSDPGLLNGIHCVAGLDHLVHETRPMKDEPPGNAYHYVIQKTHDPRYPYILHGPFKTETIIQHWWEADNLDCYWVDQ